MSNSNFFSKFFGKSNNPQRNGFNLSRTEAYSLPFGTIVPTSFDFLQPNDYVKGQVASYVQTNNMRDDNFATIYNHMKAVFVPMSSLKRNFNQFTPSIDDSKLRKDEGVCQEYYYPSVNMADLHKHLFGWYYLNFLVQQSVSQNSHILDYSFTFDGSGALTSIKDENGSNVVIGNFNKLNPAAHILVYRLQISTTVGLTTNPVLDAYELLLQLLGGSGEYFVFDALRLFDSLGYGNYWPLYSDLANQLLSLQSTAWLNYVYSSGENPYIVDISFNINQISQFFASYCPPLAQSVNVSLTKLVAFQYYIALCERDNFKKPDTFVFTLDYLGRLIEASQIDMHHIEHVQDNSYAVSPSSLGYEKFDSFLTMADMLGKNMNYLSLPVDYPVFLTYLLQLHNPLLQRDLVTGSSAYAQPGSQGTTSDLNIDNLNSVDAIYKAKLALLRAGVKASDYMQAFFGIKGDDNILEPVQVLDDTRNVVKINGIFQMAETSEAELGARGARGNGGSGLEFTLTSRGYGFLFYIQYLTCDVFYENYMISRDSRLLPEYLPTPFTANLGLDAISSSDISFYKKRGKRWENSSDRVIGYSSHDWPYKVKLNLAHGFFTNTPLTYTSTNYSNIESISKLPSLSRGNAARGGFVPTLVEQQKHDFSLTEDLYFNPTMLNGIFTQMNDGVLFSAAQFDAFSLVTRYNIYKVSSMSSIGLPKTL